MREGERDINQTKNAFVSEVEATELIFQACPEAATYLTGELYKGASLSCESESESDGLLRILESMRNKV